MTAVLPIEPSGSARGRASRVAALVAVLAAHGVLIALLALERSQIRFESGPSEAQTAIPIIFWPKPARAPAVTASTPAARPRALRRRTQKDEAQAAPAASAPPSPVQGAAEPGKAGAEPGWPSFGPNLARRIRHRIGCAHPDAYRLSDDERADCDKALGEQARTAPDLGPNVPAAKQDAYARTLHCRRIDDNNPMPMKLFKDEFRGIARMKDCPPGEH